ncbi:nitroreductase family protein [Moritella sp. F3]|uniref:nitroreductase family protein n=1 Tax=Moritella sp. F3 TaxID=2718882 RepID=UPI0018E1D97E|nr:nitroreductase family protein [Moritella sp. F3]GIC75453.1 nitroreductase [Moritella sp. F1]GIC80598.1 nitroreductase [Moritella sp. F3]
MFFRNKEKNQVLNTMKERRSINTFESSTFISDAKIEQITQYATLAPSAFNLQNWQFTAVKSQDAKTQLKGLAYGQQKVEDAAVVFIVSGLLKPQQLIEHSLKASAENDVLTTEVIEGWIGAVNSMYSENPEMQRDEAIRTASLASMNLMLAAQALGFVSCPMIGFDPAGVKDAFSLPENAVPVMLIPVGFAVEGNWPQKPRLAVNEVLNII